MSPNNCIYEVHLSISMQICSTKDKKKNCSTVLKCWEIPLLERESVNGKQQKRSCFWKAHIAYLLLVLMFLFAP